MHVYYPPVPVDHFYHAHVRMFAMRAKLSKSGWPAVHVRTYGGRRCFLDTSRRHHALYIICSVGGDVLAVHPGGEGAVRLRRDHLHPHLQPGGRVELPRRRAHPARPPALLHHRRRRRHMPLHHRLRLPGLGRGGPPQARHRKPQQAGRVL
jgi:hypothetical protein